MRVGALFSGGKDSTYAAHVAAQRGWDLAALITILPADPDSWMFHVPNLHLTPLLADAIGVPLIQERAAGGEEGELEALARAIRRSGVEGVVVGAIASDYQHSRVNRVGHELGIRVFAPLWRRDPAALLRDYLDAGYEAIVTSVSAEGLGPEWLGRRLDDKSVEDLLALRERVGLHPCGEGGEFETLVTFAPTFAHRLVILRAEVQWSGASGVFLVREARLGPP